MSSPGSFPLPRGTGLLRTPSPAGKTSLGLIPLLPAKESQCRFRAGGPGRPGGSARRGSLAAGTFQILPVFSPPSFPLSTWPSQQGRPANLKERGEAVGIDASTRSWSTPRNGGHCFFRTSKERGGFCPFLAAFFVVGKYAQRETYHLAARVQAQAQ